MSRHSKDVDFELLNTTRMFQTSALTGAETTQLFHGLATEGGAGFTGGTGTILKTDVIKAGGIFVTRILIDLTGLASAATDLDIIGTGSSPAHMGQITAARNGTILNARVTCFEAAVGGATDIDFYSAAEATGILDGAVASLTETALLTRGAAWAAGNVVVFTGVVTANHYLYMVSGAATGGTYTAGQFLVELYGY